MSQDHVETFFSLIRRMNGFNNNPTTVQFQSAYEKLLSNNINVTVPASANCTPQDDTFLITDDSQVLDKEYVTCNENNVNNDTLSSQHQIPMKKRKILGDISNKQNAVLTEQISNQTLPKKVPKKRAKPQKIPNSFKDFRFAIIYTVVIII